MNARECLQACRAALLGPTRAGDRVPPRPRSAPRVEVLEGRLLLTVFGRDDRTRVGNTTQYPWRAVDQLITTWPDGTRSQGTGAQISPRHVLTVGHIVYDASHGGWAKSIQVYAGRNGSSQPYGVAWMSYQRTYNAWIRNRNFEYDLAVLTLDRNLGNTTGWFGYEWKASSSYYAGLNLNSAGYPADKSGSLMYTMYGAIAGATTNQLYFRLDITPGQSGSPMWRYDSKTGQRFIAGVISSSTSTWNYATRINQAKYNDIRNWTRTTTTAMVGSSAQSRGDWNIVATTNSVGRAAAPRGPKLAA